MRQFLKQLKSKKEGRMLKLTLNLIFLVFYASCGRSIIDVSMNDDLSAVDSLAEADVILGTNGIAVSTAPDTSGALSWPATQDYVIPITNNGDSTANPLSMSLTDDAWSIVSDDCGGSLAAGASCNLTVRFTAIGAGTHEATVAVNYDNDEGSHSYEIDLSKEGQSGSTLTMAKVYPTNGANWMDYIKYDEAGKSAYEQDDVACDGSENTGYYGQAGNCIHGGEKIMFTTTATSCSGLSGADSLGAFVWECIDTSGNAVFYSVELAKNQGLSTLIDVNGWIPLKFSVTVGAVVSAESAETTWWTNTISNAPTNPNEGDGSLNLTGAGTIYKINSSTTSDGYEITDPKVALIILPGATLSHAGSNVNTCTNWSGSDRRCLVEMNNDFNWFEGSLDGSSEGTANSNLVLGLRRYHINHVVRNANITGSDLEGIRSYNECALIADTESSNNTGSGIIVATGYSDYATLKDIYVNDNTGHGIHFSDTDFPYVTNLRSSGNGDRGMYLQWIPGGTFENLYLSNNTVNGIELRNDSNDNIFKNIITANNTGSGIRVDSDRNVFENVKSYNNDTGINFSANSDANTLNRALTSNNSIYGIHMLYDNDNHINFITAANNGSHGIYAQYTTNANINNVVAFNNTHNGIFLMYYGGHRLYNVVSDFNGQNGVRLGTATANEFHYGLLIGENNGLDQCDSSATNLGLKDVDCTDDGLDGSTNHVGNNSTAIFYESGINVENAFIGKVTEDTYNINDTNGVANFSQNLDWFNFDNENRLWMVNHVDPIPSANHRGRATSGDVQIVDFSLSNNVSDLKNRSGDANADNEAFVAGAATCPSAVDPSYTITDQLGTPNTYLANAYEILGDTGAKAGDDDGLCEAGENCVYAPNFGYYQGSGDYLSQAACTHPDNGTPNDVNLYSMFAFPTN